MVESNLVRLPYDHVPYWGPKIWISRSRRPNQLIFGGQTRQLIELRFKKSVPIFLKTAQVTLKIVKKWVRSPVFSGCNFRRRCPMPLKLLQGDVSGWQTRVPKVGTHFSKHKVVSHSKNMKKRNFYVFWRAAWWGSRPQKKLELGRNVSRSAKILCAKIWRPMCSPSQVSLFWTSKNRKKRDFYVFRELPDGVPGHQKNQNLAGMCLLVSKDYVQKSECSSCLQAKLR
jgi:hypothetical protein